MSYPHVRVAATGRVEFFRTAEEFANSASWTEREATGWVRTEGIAPKIVQAAPDKLHLAGGWIRYNGAGQPILSNRVVYVLTNPRDKWRVQTRFACGASETWREISDDKSSSVVRRFLQLLKAGDVSECVRLVRYPFIVVGAATVQQFNTEASLKCSLPSLGLIPTKINNVSIVQNGPKGANIAVSFQSNGTNETDAIFLIENRETSYRIGSVSII